MIDQTDSEYINILRGATVLRVVLVHLGLGWFYPPYSYYIGIFLPVLFFVSGAVSFQIFKKRSMGDYVSRRMIGLWIPFWCFFIPMAFYFSYDKISFDIYSMISWLILWPDFSLFPFAMKQIWFINVLLLMVFLSLLLFPLLQRKPLVAFYCLISIFLLSLVTNNSTVSSFFHGFSFIRELNLSGQFFQTFVLCQFFLFGAMYYEYKDRFKKLYLGVFALMTAVLGFYISCLNNECSNVRLTLALRSPEFILLTYFAISLLLIFRDQLLTFLNVFSIVKKLLLYSSKNSYGIFIIHIPVLFLIEEVFDMKDLGDDLLMALLRMFLVVVATLAISAPFTYVTKGLIDKTVYMWRQFTSRNEAGSSL